MSSPCRLRRTTLTELVPKSMPPGASAECVAPIVVLLAPCLGSLRALGLRDDDDLVRLTVVREGVERLVVVVQGEAVSDDPVRACPSRPQRPDRRAERGHLGERAFDGDLTAEHVERM